MHIVSKKSIERIHDFRIKPYYERFGANKNFSGINFNLIYMAI